jgi:hypothetical protein
MTLLRATDYATVLTSPRNMGKGCALKKAFAYIEANRDIDDVTVVTMDADGQHTAADALNVLRTAEAHPGELVLGCRELPHSAPLRSRAGNAITRRVYRLSTGSSVSDTQTGLRAFDGSLLPVFTETEGSRYEYEMNVLLECPRRGIPIARDPDRSHISGAQRDFALQRSDRFNPYLPGDPAFCLLLAHGLCGGLFAVQPPGLPDGRPRYGAVCHTVQYRGPRRERGRQLRSQPQVRF